ncbi:hypothetical protein PHYPSEUDO_006742 [Phytophthora pseudosyringae]|uniref:Sugar phosphate phosphatase n=1 Tax=Phytophthora pseudosyringae TaxID=221518 RepID=A0A8T1VKW3_9STRA|nr:hypothetical protein PHYPSEUDO_006742 [Phytophthora pseudosyringae]
MTTKFLALLEQQRPYFTNVPGTFVDATYKSRMPELVRDCVAMNRDIFSPEQSERLQKLADDMINNVEIPLPSQYPEQAVKSTTSSEWESLLAGKGYKWQNAPWFLSEHYMFHLILLLTEYYTTGIDPFRPSKVAELAEDTAWRLLQTAVGLSAQEEANSQGPHDRLKRFMKLCVWGNMADGCNKDVKDAVSGADASLDFDDELLLVDHSDKVLTYLEQKALETGDATKLAVEFINDNSGTEMLLDLAMADHLLAHNWCGTVTMNVKAEPMFVSDATVPDVQEHIAEMQRQTRTSEVQALGKRLADYAHDEQLVIRTDITWNRYVFFNELPVELQTRLAREATLVIIKGDLNYRRLLCDRQWAAATPIEDVVPYFPAALVAFRTMKSNLVVGIPPEVVARWEKEDPQWPFNGSGGKRALIQSVLPASPSAM